VRVLVTADPGLPVPPRHYGGIERIIHLLVEGLVARGHAVMLVAEAGSVVDCPFVPYGTGKGALAHARNAWLIRRAVTDHQPDVIHSFSRLAYLAPIALHGAIKVMSYQRAVTPRSIAIGRRLFGSRVRFVACSRQMVSPAVSGPDWDVVFNAVPVDRFTFVPVVADNAPLVFLGRVERIKGPDLAIEIARRSGRRLIIAGNVPDEHRDYFDQQIAPHVDGGMVEYVGPVDDTQKVALLGRALAFLMPIRWAEPFGIVMAEALACGTPVLGLAEGSVPEVVRHGVTGFVEADVDGLVRAVGRAASLSRHTCRADAEARFSADALVQGYEGVYRRALDQANGDVMAAPVDVRPSE
jgi:glycosyltransferase involved in cell wall biosynthesis